MNYVLVLNSTFIDYDFQKYSASQYELKYICCHLKNAYKTMTNKRKKLFIILLNFKLLTSNHIKCFFTNFKLIDQNIIS